MRVYARLYTAVLNRMHHLCSVPSVGCLRGAVWGVVGGGVGCVPIVLALLFAGFLPWTSGAPSLASFFRPAHGRAYAGCMQLVVRERHCVACATGSHGRQPTGTCYGQVVCAVLPGPKGGWVCSRRTNVQGVCMCVYMNALNVTRCDQIARDLHFAFSQTMVAGARYTHARTHARTRGCLAAGDAPCRLASGTARTTKGLCVPWDWPLHQFLPGFGYATEKYSS